MAQFFLAQACMQTETLEAGLNGIQGITGAMVELPNTRQRVIGRRNLMTLQPDPPDGGRHYWVNWWAEGEVNPYAKVILAVG